MSPLFVGTKAKFSAWKQKKGNVFYFRRSKDEVANYFTQCFMGHRCTGVLAPVETVRNDIKRGAFADLCGERVTRQALTAAGHPKFNGVRVRGNAMIE